MSVKVIRFIKYDDADDDDDDDDISKEVSFTGL